jgi:hypothetical protein
MSEKYVYFGKAAYGRMYKCQADAMRDWNQGKDFKLVEGPYFSKRDFDSMLNDCKFELAYNGYKYPIGIMFYNTTAQCFDMFYVNSEGMCEIN